jgi:preprotein translocase subunit YajC
MKMENATRQRIARNVVLSLFIYLLPIVLMFVVFTITGQRPWEKKQHQVNNNKAINKTNSLNNGSND